MLWFRSSLLCVGWGQTVSLIQETTLCALQGKKVVEFYFKKTEGTLRQAFGTLMRSRVPETKGVKKKTTGNQSIVSRSLYPERMLYPANKVYPDEAKCKKVRGSQNGTLTLCFIKKTIFCRFGYPLATQIKINAYLYNQKK